MVAIEAMTTTGETAALCQSVARIHGAVDLFREGDLRGLDRPVVDEHLEVDVRGSTAVPAGIDGREARDAVAVHGLNAAQPGG